MVGKTPQEKIRNLKRACTAHSEISRMELFRKKHSVKEEEVSQIKPEKLSSEDHCAIENIIKKIADDNNIKNVSATSIQLNSNSGMIRFRTEEKNETLT